MNDNDREASWLRPELRLLWGESGRPPRGRRPSLSVDQIVRAATAIADAEGLPALSMQRLATELGAGTMSLYRYVSSKEELTALMLDAAIGLPNEGIRSAPNWRDGLWRWARQNLAVFRRHPWSLALVTTNRIMGPNETAHIDAALTTMAGLRLSTMETLDTVLLINSFVRGAAAHWSDDASTRQDAAPRTTNEATGGPRVLDPATLDRLGLRDRYPALIDIMLAASQEQDGRQESTRAFEFGLGCILDGVELHLNGAEPRGGSPT